MYGMGASAIAEDLGVSVEEAQKILSDFYKGFSRVKAWQDATRDNAKKTGYVEDFWGRRRRLPDMQLPLYEVKELNQQTTFNPILGTKGIIEDNNLVKLYEKKIYNAKSYKEKASIKAEALKHGITIKDNGGFISTAERESVNARVQGGAASMTKIAMRHIYDNQELRNLGFKMVLQIHDEIIGECPKCNAERCSELLSKEMRESVKEWINVPFKCDATIIHSWYEDEYENHLRNDFKKLQQQFSYEESLSKIINEHTESTVDEIYKILEINSEVQAS